ncbi:MAG: hypothetical protein WCL14_04275 [Bacteroidota bacterium]
MSAYNGGFCEFKSVCLIGILLLCATMGFGQKTATIKATPKPGSAKSAAVPAKSTGGSSSSSSKQKIHHRKNNLANSNSIFPSFKDEMEKSKSSSFMNLRSHSQGFKSLSKSSIVFPSASGDGKSKSSSMFSSMNKNPSLMGKEYSPPQDNRRNTSESHGNKPFFQSSSNFAKTRNNSLKKLRSKYHLDDGGAIKKNPNTDYYDLPNMKH